MAIATRSSAPARPLPESAAVWWTLLLLEVAMLLSPLLLTDYPPLCDLLNHMARVDILAASGSNPILSAMYRPTWHPVPNLALDVIGIGLLRLVSVSVAGRVLLALELLLCLGGTIAFHRATFGRRSYWPLAVGLVLYNAAFLMGFMNFVIGTGMALLAASAAVGEARFLRANRVPIAMVAAITLFFCHILGLVFFYVLLGAKLLAEIDWQTGGPRRADVVRIVATLGLPAIVPAILLQFSPASAAGGEIDWGSLHQRAFSAISPLINYDRILDLASALIVVGSVALFVLRRALVMPPATAIAMVVLAVAFLAVPFGIAGGFYMNLRIALFVFLLLFAGIDVDVRGHALARPIGGVLAVLFVVRMLVVGTVWSESQQDLADIRAVGAALPPGSRVLVTEARDEGNPARYVREQPRWRELHGVYSTFIYLPALWTIERQVFMPLLFTNPAQQPMTLTDAYRPLGTPFGIPPDYRGLADPAMLRGDQWDTPYIGDWQKKFDYVVVLSGGRARHLDMLDPLPLRRLAMTDIAALYQVTTPRAGAD